MVATQSQSEAVLEREMWRLFPHTFAEKISGGRWQPYPWLRKTLTMVSERVRAGNARIIINVAPRLGKSDAFSKYLPLWFLDNWPDKRAMLASYGAELARDDFGRWVRNEVETNAALRVRLRSDSSAAGRWHTPQGGGMVATGIGGSLVGRGFDLCVIDDPHKSWEEAHSTRKRNRVIDWYRSTLISRSEPGGSIVVVHQRWHENDLTGFLMNGDDAEWDQISLPMIAEPDDPLDRNLGEPLCPERYDVEDCKKIRRSTSEGAWFAMYQQRPQTGSTNAVYPNFTDANIVDRVELHEEMPLCMALDFNIRPGMHGLLGQYDGGEDVFNVAHLLHSSSMSIIRNPEDEGPSLINAFGEWVDAQGGWQWPCLHVYGDPAGRSRTDTTGISRFHVLGKALDKMGIEWKMHVKMSHPAVVARIEAVNNALCDVDGGRHVFIDRGVKRLVHDLRTNQLTDDGRDIDKSESEWTHAADAFGYWCEYQRPVIAYRDAPLGQFNV